MERERLGEYNEWWFSGKVPKELAKESKRDLFSTLQSFLSKKQIISIVGLRRVGKTTLMYQLIEELLEKGIDKKLIFYFSFDEKIENLEDVINSYREYNGVNFREHKAIIFFDEIQKLKDWENQIKKFYDLYPKIKFFVSGSETISLSKKSKENLTGRIYEFVLKPLSFKEFIKLKGLNQNLPITGIKSVFSEFIKTGGLPELIGKNEFEIKLYSKTVVDKIVFQDIAKIAEIRDTDLMKNLIEIIAVNPGMYLEYQSLAKQLDRDRRVIKSYISLLEQSFLVKILDNYRKGRISSLRKTKKIYLTDTSFCIAFKVLIDEQFFSKLVENVVITNSESTFFWKNSHEVDLIEKIPIEVKYREKIIDKDLSGIRECMKKFSFKGGIMLTKNEEKEIKVNEGKINLIPIWKWLFK